MDDAAFETRRETILPGDLLQGKRTVASLDLSAVLQRRTVFITLFRAHNLKVRLCSSLRILVHKKESIKIRE